jgi:hypothetical protein
MFLMSIHASWAVVLVVIALGIGVGLGLLLPYMQGSYVTKPGFENVVEGMDEARVVAILGPPDGTLSAGELESYHLKRFGPHESYRAFASVEAAGGKHSFWLSRSGRLLVFNVVSFEATGRVSATYSGYDTFFGLD